MQCFNTTSEDADDGTTTRTVAEVGGIAFGVSVRAADPSTHTHARARAQTRTHARTHRHTDTHVLRNASVRARVRVRVRLRVYIHSIFGARGRSIDESSFCCLAYAGRGEGEPNIHGARQPDSRCP
jgi:hypothetical protein